MTRLLPIAALSISTLAFARAPVQLTTDALAAWWDAHHVSSPISPLVDHADVTRRIAALEAGRASTLFRIREVGRSGEGRAIREVTFGAGPMAVLMWSQMHGDEPTATSALFDVYEFVARQHEDPVVRRVLDALTVYTVPMLNPDGAERFQRRNVQGLDINRDALLLQSPEGRLLKALRDEHQPRVGFNLHNQGWRTSVGRPPMGAAISLLSVAYDEDRSMNEGRLLTKRLGAVVRDAIEPLAAGRIGRYDDSFEVRAFGDNLTLWGTPVLLIETGPWPAANPDPALVRLNFIALVRALAALADGSVERADPARYDSLPENDSIGFHTIVRNVTIVQGSAVPRFTGDVGLVAARQVRIENGERRLYLSFTVDDLGDLRTSGALFEIDGTGRIVAPLIDGAQEGQPIDLPVWSAELRSPTLVLPGQPAELMLLAPGADGRLVVERIVRARVEIR